MPPIPVTRFIASPRLLRYLRYGHFARFVNFLTATHLLTILGHVSVHASQHESGIYKPSPKRLTLATRLRREFTGPCTILRCPSSPESGWDSVGGVVQQNRSWFALVTFCATTALVAALGLALLFASATVAYAVAHSLQASANPPAANPPAPAAHNVSGMVTDSKCAANHAKGSRKSPAECTRACVRGGAKYTLVDGDKIYTLQGKEDQLDRVAGERATVEGTVYGSTIQVASVSSQNAQ